MDRARQQPADAGEQRPGHPALAGAILMVGVVVLLILLAVASL